MKAEESDLRRDERSIRELVALIVENAAAAAALGQLASDGLRRTFITAGLKSGGEVRNLQGQVGHANANTRLHYILAFDVQARHAEIRLPSGGPGSRYLVLVTIPSRYCCQIIGIAV